MNTRSAMPTAVVALTALGLAVQCGSTGSDPATRASVGAAEGRAAWDVVYRVLQHPRCMNCHPAGDVPLQGDDARLHAQNVQGGPDGRGLFAMQCATCHGTTNAPGAHLPPGAPNWHLPSREMPLVFQGRSSGDLCRQMRDPRSNGGKTPDQIVEHVSHDALVLWGWDPGEGRTPVPTPHADFSAAARTWAASGCACPE